MTENIDIKKVIIIDDDLRPLTLNRYSSTLEQRFYDDSSSDYEAAISYLRDRDILPVDCDIDSCEQMFSYFASPDFVNRVLRSADFRNTLSTESQQAISLAEYSYSANSKIFNIIKGVFTGFQVKELFERPINTSDLLNHDLIIMDLMMGDNFDQIEALAGYLKQVFDKSDQQNLPICILMSSHPEVDVHRELIRSIAKISSLGFAILKKEDVLRDSGDKYLSFLWEKMSENKSAALALRKLYLEYEKQVIKALDKTGSALWNMDFAYLQQIHTNTKSENYSFSDHLLELLGSHHIGFMESSPDLQSKVSDVEKILSGATSKFQSFSRDSAVAIHQLEAARSFLGSVYNNQIKLPANISVISDLGDEDIGKIIPFGALISKGVGFPINKKRALIHCTQLCDLSRNIIRDKMSLIFIEAMIVDEKDIHTVQNVASIPLQVSSDGVRWWVVIESFKSIFALLARDVIRMFIDDEWYFNLKIRPDLARQIRGEVFNTLSRIEQPVPTLQRRVFAKICIKKKQDGNSTTHWYVDESLEVDPKPEIFVPISKFTVDGKDGHHMIDIYHHDALLWIYRHIFSINADILLVDIENILRNEMPSIGTVGFIKNSVRFALVENQNDVERVDVGRKAPIAIIFCLV